MSTPNLPTPCREASSNTWYEDNASQANLQELRQLRQELKELFTQSLEEISELRANLQEVVLLRQGKKETENTKEVPTMHRSAPETTTSDLNHNESNSNQPLPNLNHPISKNIFPKHLVNHTLPIPEPPHPNPTHNIRTPFPIRPSSVFYQQPPLSEMDTPHPVNNNFNSYQDSLFVDIHKLDVKTPETFAGEPSKVDDYVAQVKLYMAIRGGTISDRIKVLWAAGYLRGIAEKWWQAYFAKSEKEQPQWIFDLGLFIKEVYKMFGDPDRHRYSLQRLKEIRQVDSVSNYYSSFLSVAVNVNWDDQALKDAFESGLSPEIRLALANHEVQPETLKDLADQAISLYSHLQAIEDFSEGEQDFGTGDLRDEEDSETNSETPDRIPNESSQSSTNGDPNSSSYYEDIDYPQSDVNKGEPFSTSLSSITDKTSNRNGTLTSKITDQGETETEEAISGRYLHFSAMITEPLQSTIPIPDLIKPLPIFTTPSIVSQQDPIVSQAMVNSGVTEDLEDEGSPVPFGHSPLKKAKAELLLFPDSTIRFPTQEIGFQMLLGEGLEPYETTFTVTKIFCTPFVLGFPFFNKPIPFIDWTTENLIPHISNTNQACWCPMTGKPVLKEVTQKIEASTNDFSNNVHRFGYTLAGYQPPHQGIWSHHKRFLTPVNTDHVSILDNRSSILYNHLKNLNRTKWEFNYLRMNPNLLKSDTESINSMFKSI